MTDTQPGACAVKFRFEWRYLAQQVCDRMMRNRDRAAQLHVYRCPHCHGWHIGSQTVPRRRQRGKPRGKGRAA